MDVRFKILYCGIRLFYPAYHIVLLN